MSGKPLLVSELTRRIKDLLEGQIGEVLVEGEISNFRQQSSGHLYFTLKDASAQLSMVMFRGDANRLGFVPKDGQQVVAKGFVTVYEPRGNYQLRVTSLRPKGIGTLQEQFEALKRKLASEGLFDEERKKNLPVFPLRIGIVTSPTGAAIRDFIHILQRRCPRIEIVVFGVKVQGMGSAEEIAFAIAELNRRDDIDILVVARGGGSLEDLWAFNEEIVARAIAASHIPTISAIGHETDFTISDFVADLRAPTPSAAAEILSREDAEWMDELNAIKSRMSKDLLLKVADAKLAWQRLADRNVFREPRRMIEEWMQRLDELEGTLARTLRQGIEVQRLRFDALRRQWKSISPLGKIREMQKLLESRHARLRSLSPDAVLQRGYAIVTDANTKAVIKTRAGAEEIKDLDIRFADGTLGVRPQKLS